VKDVVKECTDACGGRDIGAICASSFGEAVVLLDHDGRTLQNSLIYIDIRGTEEAEELADTFGRDRALRITGASIHPMYPEFPRNYTQKILKSA
jgi:xylulokinase